MGFTGDKNILKKIHFSGGDFTYLHPPPPPHGLTPTYKDKMLNYPGPLSCPTQRNGDRGGQNKGKNKVMKKETKIFLILLKNREYSDII